MTFCDNLLKSFSENLKQLTKMNDFLLFMSFYENRMNRRYEFCMQKYPRNLSKAIALHCFQSQI